MIVFNDSSKQRLIMQLSASAFFIKNNDCCFSSVNGFFYVTYFIKQLNIMSF